MTTITHRNQCIHLFPFRRGHSSAATVGDFSDKFIQVGRPNLGIHIILYKMCKVKAAQNISKVSHRHTLVGLCLCSTINKLVKACLEDTHSVNTLSRNTLTEYTRLESMLPDIFGQVISPHRSDQMSQSSQVSRIAPSGCCVRI